MNLTPAIIQDAVTKQVLMLGYMNDEALQRTKETGLVWFYSRSKQRLWQKGEVSKNVLRVVQIFEDCDADTLLILAQPAGSACHTGSVSCFAHDEMKDVLAELAATISARTQANPDKSYTARLLQQGLPFIAAKVAEEAAEVLYAAKHETPERLKEEVCDELYHLLVLLQQRGVLWLDIETELKNRQSRSDLSVTSE